VFTSSQRLLSMLCIPSNPLGIPNVPARSAVSPCYLVSRSPCLPVSLSSKVSVSPFLPFSVSIFNSSRRRVFLHLVPIYHINSLHKKIEDPAERESLACPACPVASAYGVKCEAYFTGVLVFRIRYLGV
jgi:hypothetical protein